VVRRSAVLLGFASALPNYVLSVLGVARQMFDARVLLGFAGALPNLPVFGVGCGEADV
jgi:hypothetical protein